jgi:RimJ/RimL family protein N-acetyltransferase
MQLSEVSTENLAQMHWLFQGSQLRMVISSILSANTIGRLWTYGAASSCKFAMLWDQGNNVFYLSGESNVSGLESILTNTVFEEIYGNAIENGLTYFNVRIASADLSLLAQNAFKPWLKESQKKNFYAYNRSGVRIMGDSCNKRIAYRAIDQSLLETEKPENSEAVHREIIWMWPSLDRFYQYGFGRAAVLDGKILCWCTSEYCSSSYCGIGIETIPEMQNKGIATATACKFVSDSLECACIPHWECSVDNMPSIRVAEKVGFQLIERANAIVGQFK